jgi:hypothetical protein
MHRFLECSYSIGGDRNYTGNVTEFDVEDVSVDAVVASLYFNTVVFVLLIAYVVPSLENSYA